MTQFLTCQHGAMSQLESTRFDLKDCYLPLTYKVMHELVIYRVLGLTCIMLLVNFQITFGKLIYRTSDVPLFFISK